LQASSTLESRTDISARKLPILRMHCLTLLASVLLLACVAAQRLEPERLEPEQHDGAGRAIEGPIFGIRPIRPFPTIRKCTAFRRNYGWKSVAARPGYLFCMIYRPTTSGCSGNCGTSTQTQTDGGLSTRSCRCCSGREQRVHPYMRCLKIMRGRLVWQWVRPSKGVFYNSITRCVCNGCGIKYAAKVPEIFEAAVPDLSKETASARTERQGLCASVMPDSAMRAKCFGRDLPSLDLPFNM